MESLTLVQKLAIWVVPVLLAITVHEVMHGYVARLFGDTTAYMMGRLTLNPIKHIDPIGTVLVPAVMLLLPGGFVFGWARPVPVSSNNLRNPMRDMAIVAAAGPIANLVMALAWALIMRAAFGMTQQGVGFFEALLYMGAVGIHINLILMLLNLLPLPPLDGGRVLTGILPPRLGAQFAQIEPYGFFILIALLVTGLLGGILWPLLVSTLGMVLPLAGFSTQEFLRIIQYLIQ